MLMRWLPLIAGGVPLVAIHLCYVIAVNYGYLPSCFPYTGGCSSISATGRYPPASFLFRATEIPVAVVLLGVWYFTVQWLRALQPGLRNNTALAILISGVMGALALIIYVTFLGTKEPLYEFMRRFGIYLYFLGTTLAQLFTALSLRGFGRESRDRALNRMAAAMLWLSLLPFVLGILNLILKAVLAQDIADMLENNIEWIASLMMQVYLIVLFFAWRQTGFDVSVTTEQSHRPV